MESNASDEHAEDVAQLTPHVRNAKYERWRWQIFGITWLAYVGFYLTRKAFWVTKVDLVGESSSSVITLDQAGWIELSFGICYAIGQFIFGMSGDLFGPRKVVLAGLFFSAMACFFMGLASTAVAFGFLLGLQGLCQSTGWAPLTKNVNNFFSQHERGKIMGAWCTNYAVGGLIASLYAGWFGSQFGLQYAFFAPALTLLGVFVLFYFLQRNRPEDVGLESVEKYHGESEAVLDEKESTVEDNESSWDVIGNVLSNKMIVLLASTYFFLKPTRYAIFAWGPKFMNDSLGTNMLESGALSILFELAGPVSVFLGGFISDRIFNSRRIPVCVICLVVVAGLLVTLPFLPATRFYLGATFFLIGLFFYAPDSLISSTAAVDFGTKKGASTAAGVVNGCGSVGQILGLALPAFIVSRWGWNVVFCMGAASILVATIIIAPQWNTLPKTRGNR